MQQDDPEILIRNVPEPLQGLIRIEVQIEREFQENRGIILYKEVHQEAEMKIM